MGLESMKHHSVIDLHFHDLAVELNEVEHGGKLSDRLDDYEMALRSMEES